MSTRRRARLGQYPAKKGPDGARYCRWCKTAVQPPRKTFCSDACVHEYKLRSDPSYLGKKVFDRDGGVCKDCGIDTVIFRHETWKAAPRSNKWGRFERDWCQLKIVPPELVAQGWPKTFSRRWWEAEHVLAVVDGGGECGLENMVTVCCPCHRLRTKALAKRRAQERQAAKVPDAKSPKAA